MPRDKHGGTTGDERQCPGIEAYSDRRHLSFLPRTPWEDRHSPYPLVDLCAVKELLYTANTWGVELSKDVASAGANADIESPSLKDSPTSDLGLNVWT